MRSYRSLPIRLLFNGWLIWCIFLNGSIFSKRDFHGNWDDSFRKAPKKGGLLPKFGTIHKVDQLVLKNLDQKENTQGEVSEEKSFASIIELRSGKKKQGFRAGELNLPAKGGLLKPTLTVDRPFPEKKARLPWVETSEEVGELKMNAPGRRKRPAYHQIPACLFTTVTNLKIVTMTFVVLSTKEMAFRSLYFS